MIDSRQFKKDLIDNRLVEIDTLIVGGGIAGLYIADRLTKAGISCIVLEAGCSSPIGDWRKLSWYIEDRDRVDVHSDFSYNEKLSWVKSLGGGTEAWEGYTPRWTSYDFKTMSNFGKGLDWPIGYSDLSSYYYEAEKFLGVAGNDDNPHDEPRNEPFPLPGFEFDSYEKNIVSRVKDLNWHHVPQARNSIAYKKRSFCTYVGTCNSCPTQARWSPSAALLPALAKRKNLEIITNSSCLKITPDKNNRAVDCQIHTNEIGLWNARFRNLVLAAGAVETARLLLISKSSTNRNGFLNDSGNVGKGFMDHPVQRIRGEIEWPHFKQTQTNILASSHDFRKYNQDQDTWGFIINLNSRSKGKLWIASHFEMPSFKENQIFLSSNRKDFLGRPMADINFWKIFENFPNNLSNCKKVLKDVAKAAGGKDLEFDPFQQWACHPMGGCIISNNPSDGVVNENLRAWESPNTYILSNGIFCSGAAVNPTLTLVALGIRLGDHLTK